MKIFMNTLLGAALLALPAMGFAAKMDVDTKKSSIGWVGKKVTGQHNGILKLKSGTFNLAEGKGTFVMDMKSIDTKDLSGDTKKKLDGHLKSDDFFNVKKYPEAKFVLESVKPEGAAKDGKQKYKMTGELTIKGIGKKISFTGEYQAAKKMLAADFKINRTEWDIKYNSGKFFDPAKLADKLIYDDIDIQLSLVGK